MADHLHRNTQTRRITSAGSPMRLWLTLDSRASIRLGGGLMRCAALPRSPSRRAPPPRLPRTAANGAAFRSVRAARWRISARGGEKSLTRHELSPNHIGSIRFEQVRRMAGMVHQPAARDDLYRLAQDFDEARQAAPGLCKRSRSPVGQESGYAPIGGSAFEAFSEKAGRCKAGALSRKTEP
jgi:hypothetical protein